MKIRRLLRVLAVLATPCLLRAQGQVAPYVKADWTRADDGVHVAYPDGSTISSEEAFRMVLDSLRDACSAGRPGSLGKLLVWSGVTGGDACFGRPEAVASSLGLDVSFAGRIGLLRDEERDDAWAVVSRRLALGVARAEQDYVARRIALEHGEAGGVIRREGEVWQSSSLHAGTRARPRHVGRETIFSMRRGFGSLSRGVAVGMQWANWRSFQRLVPSGRHVRAAALVEHQRADDIRNLAALHWALRAGARPVEQIEWAHGSDGGVVSLSVRGEVDAWRAAFPSETEWDDEGNGRLRCGRVEVNVRIEPVGIEPGYLFVRGGPDGLLEPAIRELWLTETGEGRCEAELVAESEEACGALEQRLKDAVAGAGPWEARVASERRGATLAVRGGCSDVLLMLYFARFVGD